MSERPTDTLDAYLAGPLPVTVAIAALDLTDEQRLAVCRELRQVCELCGLPPEVAHYEAAAKGRLGR